MSVSSLKDMIAHSGVVTKAPDDFAAMARMGYGVVIICVDVDRTGPVHQFAGVGVGVVVALAKQHDVGPVALRAADLDERRAHGHHDGGFYAQTGRMGGDSLGVVASRGGDDATGSLTVGQGQQPVEGTAGLERTGELEVLKLEPDVATGQGREPRRTRQGRADDAWADAVTSSDNVSE